MSKIIPYERNPYSLWYDERPEFEFLNADRCCREADKLMRQGNTYKAARLYLQGAEKGDPECLCSVGLGYQFQLGFWKDLNYAFNYYFEAMQKGHPLAKNMLFRLYTKNRVWGDNYSWPRWTEIIDFDILEKEIYEEGFGSGLLAQANYYWYKVGKPLYTEAFGDYILCNDPDGFFYTVYHEFKTPNVLYEAKEKACDRKSYIDEYLNQRGIEKGFDWCYLDLADYYMEDEHRDVMKAMDICLKVKKRDSQRFYKYLDQFRMEDILPGREREAFQYFLKNALRKKKYAYEALGRCYMEGIGTERNLDKAKLWFDKAEKI